MGEERYIFGIRAIIEAIGAETPINKVFLQKGLQGDLFSKLEGILRKEHISTSYVPLQKLEKLARGNHQGAVALIASIGFKPFELTIETILEEKTNPL